MGNSSNEIIQTILSKYNCKTAEEVQFALKDLFAGTLQEMLEAELDNHLGYSKYDYQNKDTDNSRNGKRKKNVKSDLGNIEIDIPRDRLGTFEPQVIKNHQNDISKIEDQILGMYAKGMSTRDIAQHLEDIYGIEASPTFISNITDRIIPLIKEWQNRPLDTVYPIIFMDAIHYNVRHEGRVVKKAAYIALGIDLEGEKDILGIWIGENESAKYWMRVLTDLKARGIQDILIASIDGLSGFKEAISAIFPKTDIQKCIVHQIRNTIRYISYKDQREFMKDLKLVYKAVNEETALIELDRLDEKWGKKYPLSISTWRNNWVELTAYFKYPEELRRIIYTTNSIESYNRMLRKVTKSKSIFPTDDSLLKSLYLATMDITKKWSQKVQAWNLILAQLTIYFEDRIPRHI